MAVSRDNYKKIIVNVAEDIRNFPLEGWRNLNPLFLRDDLGNDEIRAELAELKRLTCSTDKYLGQVDEFWEDVMFRLALAQTNEANSQVSISAQARQSIRMDLNRLHNECPAIAQKKEQVEVIDLPSDDLKILSLKDILSTSESLKSLNFTAPEEDDLDGNNQKISEGLEHLAVASTGLAMRYLEILMYESHLAGIYKATDYDYQKSVNYRFSQLYGSFAISSAFPDDRLIVNDMEDYRLANDRDDDGRVIKPWPKYQPPLPGM